MNTILTIRQDAEHKNLHATILALIDKYRFDIDCVYFMDKAVTVLKNTDSKLTDDYVSRALEFDIKLICCGRALTEQGLEVDSLTQGVEVAGYTDLAVAVTQAKKVISF